MLTQVQGAPDLQTPALTNKTPWTCIFHKNQDLGPSGAYKHDKPQYFSSAVGYCDLAVSMKQKTQSQPVQRHIRNPMSWSQLLYRNLWRQTERCCSFRLPLRNLIAPDLQMGAGTQTIVSWGLQVFFNKTRDKLNPHDLIYNLDNNEYLSSCAIKISESKHHNLFLPQSKHHNLFLPHYFSLSDKYKQLNASICFMYYK